MDDTLDPRPSPKVIALKDFSRYQINPEPKGSSSNQPRRKSFKSSIQELKFKRKVVFDAPGLETLPGVTEPLMGNHDVSYADIEKTMKDDEGSLKNISFLGIGDQIKYWSLLLLFTICRGALYPALAMVPYSIVPKLVWRNLLVENL